MRIKKIIIPSLLGLISCFSMASHAEFYANFYNNSEETLQIVEINTGGGYLDSNAKVHREIPIGGQPPHLWFKALAPQTYPGYVRKITLMSKSNRNNWCRFTFLYGLNRKNVEVYYSARDYRAEGRGFKCEIAAINGNTGHFNIS